MAFNNEARIRLHGNQGSQPVTISDDIDVGPKSMLVLGKLQLFGQRRTTLWTSLGKTVNPGDTEIEVTSSVDWQVGTTRPAAIYSLVP